MDNDEKDRRIKELEEENYKLRIQIRNLNDKIASKNRALNRSYRDNYEYNVDIGDDRR